MSLAQAQTTSLRQQQIFEGDIAELTIEYESNIPSLYAIDTSILDKDFIVLDTHSSVTRVIAENQTLHRMRWAVQLVPRHSGNLPIPALEFGENHSEPMVLEVSEFAASQQAQQSVFVEVEAYPQNPYPGQQVRIATRLFHQQELHDAILTEPKIQQRPIVRSGRDVQYEAVRGDTNYKVVERSILLTANAGEQLTIEPATFRGSIRANGASASAVNTRFIFRDSNALSLKLRALPPGFDAANWLPAQRLELELDWDEMDANP
ncbi:MAG TPA: BatD family protein, partial [Gammaproteobacteria bacterium]|nr:BatD family protein [Gammaproteobacteria bacterium]